MHQLFSHINLTQRGVIHFRNVACLNVVHFLSLAFLLSYSISSLANNEVVLENGFSKYLLGEHVEYFEDSTGNLSFEEIRSVQRANQFTQNLTSAPSFGFSNSVFWFHTRIRNENNNYDGWYLQLPYPLLDVIDVYQVGIDGKVEVMRAGDLLSFKQRSIKHRTFLFDVFLPIGTVKDIYVRIKTETSMQATMVLWEKEAFYQENQNHQYLFGIYYGVILSMLIYNLLVFVSIRDNIYLFYVFHILSFSLFQACLNGLSVQYLWPDSPWWGQRASVFFMALACLNAIIFTRSLLQLKTNLPQWDASFKYIMIALVGVMICTFLFPYRVMGQIGTIAGLVVSVLLNIVGWISLKNKNKLAVFYVVAWTLFLLGGTVYALKTYNFLPQMFITEYAIQIGSMFDVVLLSLVLSYRVKLLENKNIQIQIEAKQNLERKVTERTKKLNETLDALTNAYEKVEELSYTDVLTGIKNRKFFDEFYEHEWNNALRSKKPIALMLVDLDNFKNINDAYGHQAGDKVLVATSNAIKQCLPRKNDVVVRYGGDEFVVVLPLTDKQAALLIAERIMDAISKVEMIHGSDNIPIEASIGISAVLPTQNLNPASLISQADSAMYDAKKSGRNCIRSN
jgi:diguanylate cyclase (GGDEF)-like protein